MDALRARDLGFDDRASRAAYGPVSASDDEQLEHDLLSSTLALESPDAGPDPASAPRPSQSPGQSPRHPAYANDASPASGTSNTSDAHEPDATGAADPAGPGKAGRRDFGPSGTPFNRQSPFYIGFFGAVGVLTAYAVVQSVGRLGTVITLLVISFFLTLSLNPLVEALTRRRLRRGWSVAIVFLGMLALFTLVGWVVIPPVAQQGSELATNAPRLFDNILANPWVQDVDHRYQLVQRIQEEVNKRVADGNLWAGVFGGVLDAGKVIASGVFSFLTVLVLTLYVLASLPAVKQAAYALVPASRRPRTVSLSEEVMRRVGSYAIGQVVVAAINAFFAWIMMSLIGLRFAAVLAVAVGCAVAGPWQ